MQEIWAHPSRVVSEVSLRLDGAPGTVHRSLRTPALAERELGTPTGDVVERWTASAAHAACAWEVAAGPATRIELACTAEHRRAGQAGAPPVEVTRDARGVCLAHPGGPSVEILLARGDSIEPVGGSGDTVRLLARARGTLRLVVIAGADADDLARARERVERRGIAAITDERAQHARLLADYGTAIESPAADEVAAFEWAKADSDGLLVVSPDGARFAEAYHEPGGAAWKQQGPVKWAGPGAVLSLGAALLAAGLRDPVREWLRFSAATSGTDGSAPALAAAYHDWTGEPMAPTAGSATHPMSRPRTAAQPGAPWAPLVRELISRWGVAATAGGSLALAPAMPDDRHEAAVRRLRIGTSVIDAELRRRFDRTVVRLYRRHGPPLPVALELPGAPPLAITADDQPLPVGRVVLSVSDRHEVMFQR